MKRLVALAAALLAAPLAHANTHCDAPGGVLIRESTFATLPPGLYQTRRSADGREVIFVPQPNAPGGGFNIPVAQLSALGIPFEVQTTTPLQLTCGSPVSANFQSIADALDLDFDFDADGDADTIGGAATVWGVAGEDGQRFDLKYGRGMRLSESSRARLVLTLPVRYLRVNDSDGGIGGVHGGLSALSVGMGVGVQLPAAANWWLTPRVSYTATAASRQLGGDNEILAATVSSNYRFAGLGRGELTMANLVGYTQAIRTGLTAQDRADYFKQRNWWFRNGLAYQLPLGGRMFGRQTSLRTSYVFTLGAKDTMAFEQVHEAAISFGFRMRETEQRTGSDLLRVGLLYTHAKNEYAANADYDALTLTMGYRF